MKTVNHIKMNYQLLRLIIPAILLCSLAGAAYAQVPSPGGKFGPTNTPLDSWSFNDHTNWTSDLGYAPISFTNLSFSHLGNGDSLVVDTNIPAWLQYNVYENDGTTNLTVDSGSVTFWYAPGDWSSTNAGGTGPGEWGRLFEVGAYTPDSSYGLWSIYVDDVGKNIYFSAQTNDLSSTLTTYLSSPISWTTNYFHFVALTYSPTNTALYLDGVLATNGPGVTIYPGPDVLTNGFYHRQRYRRGSIKPTACSIRWRLTIIRSIPMMFRPFSTGITPGMKSCRGTPRCSISFPLRQVRPLCQTPMTSSPGRVACSLPVR